MINCCSIDVSAVGISDLAADDVRGSDREPFDDNSLDPGPVVPVLLVMETAGAIKRRPSQFPFYFAASGNSLLMVHFLFGFSII